MGNSGGRGGNDGSMTDGTMSSTGERKGNTGLWEIAVGEGEMTAQRRTMSSTGEREGTQGYGK